MSITPSAWTKDLARGLFATAAFLLGSSASAETIVLPNVTGFVVGAQDALWSTEIRITNPSEAVKRLRIIDWLGVDGVIQTLEIEPGEIRIISGWELIYGGQRGSIVSLDEDIFGAAVCEKDEGLLVQSVILTYTLPPRPFSGFGLDSPCDSWGGGHEVGYSLIPCNPGAGPMVTNDQSFFPAGREFVIPYLFTFAAMKRENIVLLNPDANPSDVEISITSADGKVTRTNRVTVGPRSFLQIDQLFRRPEWQDFLDAAGTNQREKPAARARIRATTRLYALGYVISWDNNTVSVSLPM